MSSTNFIGESNKTSSKVLRPPGGNSNLFGDDAPQTPRHVKNHMASNIFGSEAGAHAKQNGDNARRNPKHVDSYSRLFGEPERNFTPAKNHMKSSIPIGGATAANGSSNGIEQNGHKNGNGVHHQNGNGTSGSSSAASTASSSRNGKMENGGSSCASSEYQNGGVSRTDGNPVTGEGYKGAEINTAIPALNGANQVINKNRIPPGGYSSGLW